MWLTPTSLAAAFWRSSYAGGYDTLTAALRGVEYGSAEYRAALDEAHETIQHHYAMNSHHPEHHADGVAGMSLLDLIEMVADWKAASERSGGRNMMSSIGYNAARWGIDPQLKAIIANTIKEMGW